jgi:restriction system protein
MPIPDFQSIMRPLLSEYEDGVEQAIRAVRERLADQFRLTPAEREERLPSGAAKTFANRVGWATTYLFGTGLLERPRRGVYRITDRGRNALREAPERIDLAFLSRFPELAELRSKRDTGEATAPTGNLTTSATPEETIDAAYAEHRQALEKELLERIQLQSPAFFEQLVLDLLQAMGYGGSRADSAERLGRSGDEGLDGVIWEDRLGLDLVYVQAKRWQGAVGRPVVQGFVGALQGKRAQKGVLISSSSFSREAWQYAETVTPRVILVDGDRLASLMVEFDVGVSMMTRYALKRVDADYFGDEDGTGPG